MKQTVNFPVDGESQVPVQLHDLVFANPDQLLAVGASSTPNALPGGDGEPTKWVDSIPQPAGLDNTIGGNSGEFFAANEQGTAVGSDDLRPIGHEGEETFELPLPAGYTIGGAKAVNNNRIVGYADADAIVWESPCR